MKVDVAKHVVEILLDNGTVRIPGFGNFDIINHPAQLTVGKQQITPPSISVAFSEEYGESNELLIRLKKGYGLKKSEARKAVGTFAGKLLNSLINLDKVRIKGLGVISKGDDESLVFEANKGFVSQFYKGLPDVSTQIDLRSAGPESTVAAVVEKEEESLESFVFEEKEELDVEELVSDEIESETAKQVEEISLEDEIEVEEAVVAAASIEPADASLTVNESYEEILESKSLETSEVKEDKAAPYVPLIEREEERKSSILWPLILLTMMVLLALLGLRKCTGSSDKLPVVVENSDAAIQEDSTQGVASLNNGEQEEDDTTATAIGDVDNQEGSQGEAGTSSGVSEDASISVDPDECIIITGVFASERNAKRMMRDLNAAGYIPYAEQYGDNMRVGFKFDCGDVEDLPAYLRVIRSNVSGGAWYLQPKLAVN